MENYRGMHRIYFSSKEDFENWLNWVQEQNTSYWGIGKESWLNHYDENGKECYYLKDYKNEVGFGELEYARKEGLEVVDFAKQEYITWGNQVIRVYNMLKGE